jgi:N-hydroxyarylamine O-acetyltransferase
MLTKKQLKKYLNHIQLSEEIINQKPSFNLLNLIHEHHVFSIPFENLSIFLDEPIKIDLESLYEKLIINQRGGYCYEINSLFQALLTTLGFDTQLHLAEVVYNSPLLSRVPRHAILLVTLDNFVYLVDAGYGRNGMSQPLLLNREHASELTAHKTLFKAEYREELGFLYQVFYDDEFHIEYRFDYPHYHPISIKDLEPHNLYVSTNEESNFTKNTIITMPTPTGRISLNNDKLREISDGTRKERLITNLQDYLEILSQRFNIRVSEDKLRLPFEFKSNQLQTKFFSKQINPSDQKPLFLQTLTTDEKHLPQDNIF